jgi:hypothetical protein
MDSLQFGSASGSLFAFAFFSGFAAAIGWIIFRLMDRTAATPWDVPSPYTQRRARVVISTLVVLPILAAVYSWLWTSFYRLDSTPEGIRLTYFMPTRQVNLIYADIERVYWRRQAKGGDVLVITTRDGRYFEGAGVRLLEWEYARTVRLLSPHGHDVSAR